MRLRAICLRLINDGDILAVIARVKDDLAVQVFGPPSRELLECLELWLGNQPDAEPDQHGREASDMIVVGVRGHQEVDPPDAERGQLSGHEVEVGTAIDDDGGASRRAHHGAVTPCDVEEDRGEGLGHPRPEGARPKEQRKRHDAGRQSPAWDPGAGPDPRPEQNDQDDPDRELA